MDLNILLYSGIGMALFLAFVLVRVFRSDIVSIVSRVGGRMAEEGAARRAYRHRVYDMSSNAQTGQTNQTDGQTDEQTRPDPWIERLQLDRSKQALIELLVYSDWDVSQIRGVIKGDNGVLGQEIEAARQRLGKQPSAHYKTPIAGRPTNANYYPSEPELEYVAP